jgi:hypothetical protein
MTNFVFSRRDLQQCLDRLAGVLDSGPLTRLVAALNRQDRHRLPAMWEAVVLDALARACQLRHEVPLSSGHKPDFELHIASPQDKPLVVIGDVATVSDDGVDDQNPVDVLFAEGARIARIVGVDPSRFDYRVEGGRIGRRGDARVKLQLPPKPQLLTLLNGPVKTWMAAIRSRLAEPSAYCYDQDGFRFTIQYAPNQRYASGTYTSYDVAASLEKNPLYKALKAKRNQLAQAPADALRVIVVCDGDCALMRRSPFGASDGTYTAREIASHFLNKSQAIDAVWLITVDSQRRPMSHQETHSLRCDLEVAERATDGHAQSSRVTRLATVLRAAEAYFPAPCQSPINAALRCRDSAFASDHNGAYRMHGERISISSRGLLDLLSAQVTSEEYHRDQAWADGHIGNPFAIMREQGRLIQSIQVEPMAAPDDDWLSFEFGPSDPATSSFRVPSGAVSSP